MQLHRAIGATVMSFLVCLTAVLQAGTVVHHYTFSAPEITQTDDGSRVVMNNTRLLGIPGEPLLPVFGVSLLLPPGEAIINAEIMPGEKILIPGNYQVIPAQEEYPLSYEGPYQPILPKPEIYDTNLPYPQITIASTSTHYYRGYSIGTAAVIPVVYYPKSGQLFYYRDLEVIFHTASQSEAVSAINTKLRSDNETRSALSRITHNTESIISYPTRDENREIPVNYVIITNSAMIANFQALADFKNRRGVRTIIETVENISATQSGADLQEKIRNYIISAYTNSGIDYVLLAGDDEILPDRGLYASAYGETDADIASDLYYGGLDGNWNTDHDSYWGEAGEDDLIPEVAVGRAAVDSPTEADNFIHKQIMYQQSPVTTDCNKALFAGELLWDDVTCQWTFGGTYKEEVRLGSSNYGYTTVGFPGNFITNTMYDLSICPSSWSALNGLRPLMNGGQNLINHLGHANVTYGLRFNNSDVTDANFTNNGVNQGYYTIYTQGCYDASFDNRTTSGTYTEDCIAEKFTTIQNGAVCFVGNSRYGWGYHQSTNGSSQYYDRQFFDAVFGENLTHIGQANDDSKVDNIWAIDYGANRWCYYELNVLGDPELDFWTAIPTSITANYPSAYVMGQDTFRVTVPSVSGAVVALNFNNTLVGRGVTAANGQVDVVLDDPPNEPGIMTLVITAHNRLEYTDSIQVVPPSGPYVIYRSNTINDATGNNNGLLDFGETIGLTITMENVGSDAADEVMVTMNTTNPYITITDGAESYGTIPAYSQVSIPNGFALTVSPYAPDNHVISLDIIATSNELDQWQDDFSLISHAPTLDILSFTINDATGNGNEYLDPNENATVSITLSNSGSADLSGITGTLMSDFPYLTLAQNSATLTSLPSGGNGILTPSYSIQVGASAPNFSRAVFYLDVSGIRNYSNSLLHEETIGGYHEFVENGQGSWTHTFLTSGFTDQWHISTEMNHSPTHAWKCGDTGTGNYANLLDAILTTPTITIPSNTQLRFWHYMQAETSSLYPDSAYDGGVVEISVNGGAFQPLTPNGGYTHHIRCTAGGGNPYTGPFAGRTACFSGSLAWSQVIVDLSSFSGNIQIRFRFGSDQATPREGWYVDDIEIVRTDDLQPPSNLEAELVGTTVNLTWNSPGAAGRSLQGYNLYRNGSLLTSEIPGLNYQDNLTGMPEGIYNYSTTAVYGSGESVHSNSDSIYYTDAILPVTDLVVERLGSSIVLTWSPVVSATGYKIYRGFNPYAEPSEMTVIATVSNPTYTDSDIIGGLQSKVFYLVTATR